MTALPSFPAGVPAGTLKVTRATEPLLRVASLSVGLVWKSASGQSLTVTGHSARESTAQPSTGTVMDAPAATGSTALLWVVTSDQGTSPSGMGTHGPRPARADASDQPRSSL